MAETAIPVTFLDAKASKWARNQTKELFLGQNITMVTPLTKQLEFASADVALRIWIVDNAVSMNRKDQCQFAHSGGNLFDFDARTAVKCTRWDELKETVLFHARLAIMTKTPIFCHLVNSCPNVPQDIPIVSSPYAKNFYGDQQGRRDWERLFQSIKPSGRRLLTRSIHEIRLQILSIKTVLQVKSQLVLLTLATDGLPADENGSVGGESAQNFVHALQTIEHLPIILIVRLSTDEQTVTHFYSEYLTRRVKLRIIVLGDFAAEARRIQSANPWLRYTPTIHRIREIGHAPKCLDHVSSRLLTPIEMRDCCIFLLGYNTISGILDPLSNWSGFIESLRDSMTEKDHRWDPSVRSVIDIRRLNQCYRPSKQQKRRFNLNQSVGFWALFISR